MRPPSRWFLLALALPACHSDPPSGVAEGSACPLTERVRLASAPGRFEPEDLYYALHLVGDHLLFSFDDPLSDDRDFWHTPACGGPVEAFTSLTPGLQPLSTVQTDSGPVLYAVDPNGRVFLTDRLDVPGFDEPRAIQDLPPLSFWFAGFISTPKLPYASFSIVNPAGDGAVLSGAAGIGALTWSVYAHAGDANAPAVKLDPAVVASTILLERYLALDDDGTLRRIDPLTGASEIEQAGVRHASYAPDGQHLIWQELGDDVAEPIHLRDLTTSDDLEIGINDFAALSWGRAPDDPLGETNDGRNAGRWSWTADSAFAALVGPTGAYVAAVRTATGEALTVPEHIGFGARLQRHLILVLADPTDHVEAIWDPDTGALVPWYRGPTEPTLKRFDPDGTVAEFLIPDEGRPDQGALVRVDLTTGALTELVPHVSNLGGWLTDDLYLDAPARTSIPIPSPPGVQVSVSTQDLTIIDTATQTYYPVADNVGSRSFLTDGLIVLDAHGDDPGVWAIPLPPGHSPKNMSIHTPASPFAPLAAAPSNRSLDAAARPLGPPDMTQGPVPSR